MIATVRRLTQMSFFVFAAIHDEVGGDAAEGFGKDGRGAAVQEAVGLSCSFVDGHGCLEIVVADPGKNNSEVVAHGVVAEGLDIGGFDVGMEPDGHRGWFNRFGDGG
jgi:hypothetical protein